MIPRWKDNRNLTYVHIHIAIQHKSSLVFFVRLFKGLLICFRNNEDRIFQTFCEKFLPPEISLKKLDSEQHSDERLLMVFILPSVNRQNNAEAICSYIRQLKKKYHLDGICGFYLIKINNMYIMNSFIYQYILHTYISRCVLLFNLTFCIVIKLLFQTKENSVLYRYHSMETTASIRRIWSKDPLLRH